MFQLDGAAELQAILDGVFKPAKREERRTRQRYSRQGMMHQPLSLNYQGDMTATEPDKMFGKPAPRVTIGVAGMIATTEDLIRAGYAEGRVINPPPPTPSSDDASNTAGTNAYAYGMPKLGQSRSDGE